MTTNTVTLNLAALVFGNLPAKLMVAKVSCETLIQNIDERLAMPLPEAAHPLSQTKLEIIWRLYREVISASKKNAAAQLEIYNLVITALTDGSSMDVCGRLLDDMSFLLTPLQRQAKVSDPLVLSLAKEIIVLAPHLEQLIGAIQEL